MRQALVGAILGSLLAATPGSGSEPAAPSQLEDELRAAERAFAKTMADRDHQAFSSFLADETIFIGRAVLRGKAAVAEVWRSFYEGPQPPFSWDPDLAVVLDSGTLGLTSGPVLDPSGKRVGTFSSTWRREPDGRWRIVFDKGCPPCECP